MSLTLAHLLHLGEQLDRCPGSILHSNTVGSSGDVVELTMFTETRLDKQCPFFLPDFSRLQRLTLATEPQHRIVAEDVPLRQK